jgi:hypothetical protein
LQPENTVGHGERRGVVANRGSMLTANNVSAFTPLGAASAPPPQTVAGSALPSRPETVNRAPLRYAPPPAPAQYISRVDGL